MLEVKGDLFSHAGPICIPVNSEVGVNGRAIMGAGIAKRIANTFPDMPARLGDVILRKGNPVHLWDYGDGLAFFTFPTKYKWREDSNLGLIKKSAIELLDHIDNMMECGVFGDWYWESVGLPQVGCGLGNLSWYGQVYPILSEILDDRFVVYS